MPKNDVQVGILMGSDSDADVMVEAYKVIREFGVGAEMVVTSAHRSPKRTALYVTSAEKRGIKVLICGAGHAAHLAGVVASHTTLPVVGVPIDSSSLKGLDALLATVQMPAGMPVGTMAIGKSGARNAGLFALQIIALGDKSLTEQLKKMREKMEKQVEEKDKQLQKKYAE